MSIEAVWDLQQAKGSGSPRSLCVYYYYPSAAVHHAAAAAYHPHHAAAPTPSRTITTNPFDTTTNVHQHHHHAPSSVLDQQQQQQQQQQQSVMVAAAVIGTANGALHYRTYPMGLTMGIGSAVGATTGASSSTTTSSSSNTSSSSKMVLPLGISSRGGGGRRASNQQIPPQFLPLDLRHHHQHQSSALWPVGPIVSVICCTPSTSSSGSSSSSRNKSSSSQQQQHRSSAALNYQQQQQQQQQTFLLLIDDGRGSVSTGNYTSRIVTLSSSSFTATATTTSSAASHHHQQQQPGFQIIPQNQEIRMSCAVYCSASDATAGTGAGTGAVYYGAGRKIHRLDVHKMMMMTGSTTSFSDSGGISTSIDTAFPNQLPAPGIRSGQDALAVLGKVAVAAVGNSFYAAVIGKDNDNVDDECVPSVLKIASFQQSSQVHPAIVIDLHDTSLDGTNWSSLFLASGRECAVVDVYYDDAAYHDKNMSNTNYMMMMMPPPQQQPDGTTTNLSSSSSSFAASKPRHGTVTTTASPILAAAAVPPWWVAVLTSDGLISIRSPSCLAVPLRTVEVGQRPNDYFVLRSILPTAGAVEKINQQQQQQQRNNKQFIVAAAYSGECKVLQCRADTAQDLADRLMRHAIDAFGANGFPRSELAQAVNASFTATSYSSPSSSSSSAAEAVNTTTTTSASAVASSPQAAPRILLKQYLEAVLGLADFESGASSGWPTEFSQPGQVVHHGTFAAGDATMKTGGVGSGGAVGSSYSGRGAAANAAAAAANTTAVVSSSSPAALLSCTALLCLVCSQLSPPNSVLANRAAKSCAEKMGVVFESSSSSSPNNNNSSDGIPKAAIQVCELVAEKLLREASSNFSLLTGSSPAPITAARSMMSNRSSQSSLITDFIEAAVWLLRSCGKHERAIDVAYERLQQQQQQPSESGGGGGGAAENVRGVWSQIKYESYTATHLSEIWGAGKEEGCRLVLSSPVTQRLLEHNPRLGLSVFTAMHPQNESQWRSMPARDDPLVHVERVYKVLELLKSINPAIPTDKDRSFSLDDDNVGNNLPLESGRAVAVSFLWSAIGISSGRLADDDEFDSLPIDADYEEHVANFHDELSFLLLEGVILERPEDDKNEIVDTELGSVYRSMLRELLKWPLAKIRPEHFMESLPPTFLQEKALVLGRLGRHDEALQILYRDLKNLDLALEYCDDRHAQQKEEQERLRARQQKENIYRRDSDPMLEDLKSKEEDNAYLPLIRVALESEDTERGTATAIKVLALRRSAIDRAAALRLLPSEVPVSAVARPFLIPALVESESQVRRMTVVSALLRSRYLRLKDKLTTAQLRAQANIHVVPALRSLNLGDPLHSTKSFRARTSSNPSPTMPDVQIVKHFFPRHLVIQAKVTNVPYSAYPSSSSTALYAPSDRSTPHQTQTMLSDIAFVVAESSEEEAIQPLLQVPIQLLPPKMTGSAWCVLSASPDNMDGSTAQLTCELRYSVQSVDAASSTIPAAIGSTAILARTFVEELQDLEVHAAHFS